MAKRQARWVTLVGALFLSGCVLQAPAEEPVEVAPATDAFVPQMPPEPPTRGIDSGIRETALRCPTPATPPPGREAAYVDYVSLRDVILNDQGRSARKTFTIPDDAVSATVVVRGDDELTFVVEELVGPGGRTWVSAAPSGVSITDDDQAHLLFPGPFLSPNRTYWAGGVAAALIPNNPGVELVPGEYTVRVAALDRLGWPARDVVQVGVQILRAPRETTRARLDLHFYFTGAHGWTRDSAGCDLAFRQMLRAVYTVYREAGVEVGRVTFSSAPARFQRVELQDLPLLYAHSEHETGVPVFLVGSMVGPEGMPVGGMAGGVPGPPGMPGSPRSGVAIATHSVTDPQQLGLVVAHEVGHYLGLFHPSEWEDTYHDQLDDTPEGAAAAGNVMYLSMGDPEQHFTPQQADVLFASPIVRHLAD